MKKIRHHSFVTPSDIRDLALGKQTAFKQVYDVHSEQVYQLAFHFLKERTLCEDLVQEVFLKLWQNRAELDEQGNLWLYLYVVTKRLCLNKLREIRRSDAMLRQLLAHMEQLDTQAESALYADDMESHFNKVLESLPKQQQLIFRLSRVEGLTHQEISKQLQISTNTVKNHMVKALKTLKKSLPDLGKIFLILLFFIFN